MNGIEKAIKELQRQVKCWEGGKPFGYAIEPLKTAISAMQELQQYRQIGTLEECREAREK